MRAKLEQGINPSGREKNRRIQIQTLQNFSGIDVCVLDRFKQADRDAGRDHRSRLHKIAWLRGRSRPNQALSVNLLSQNVKKALPTIINNKLGGKMDFQVKLFNWQDQGNHLIILARGVIDSEAFRLLFEEIEAATRDLSECKVLIDLSDSACRIECAEIQGLVARLSLNGWPLNNKVAFVSASDIADYHRLFFLRTELAAHHLAVGVFRNSKVAIDWLAGIM